MTEPVPDQVQRRIRRLYAAFNEGNIDTVLAGLTVDVAWANGMEGGHVHGHGGVRDYWMRQFQQIRSTVEPHHIELAPDGRVAVQVHQVVQSADGSQLLDDTWVRHLFTFRNGQVSRFDIA